MSPPVQLPYTVFRQLASEGVPLSGSAELGEGLAAARWLRNEVTQTRYRSPNHHTVSLYVAGGSGIRRRRSGRELASFGAGSLCLMPAGETTDWLVAGAVDLFHLYIPTALFERTALAAFDRNPAAVELPERVFLSDPWLERTIRQAFLDKDWREPAERLALSQVSHDILAHVLCRYATVGPAPAVVKGGLAPAALHRVKEYVDAGLERALTLGELARVARLSPYHFSRMFKQSTGESPHVYVVRRRVARAKTLLARGWMPIAEIAGACGFSSQSHFTAAFRRHTGVTPRRYRAAVN